MFARILLPLDGSRLAESALPAAEAFQRAFDSTVTLIHVLESPAPKEVHGERHLRDLPEAESYLEQISKRFPKGARIERHVHIGGISDVSLSLSAHSRELEQQLIIMCVHGRGGILRLVSGNLAERIMREQTVPVLLVRTGGGTANSGGIGTVLAALDGKPDHDQGFPMAVEIASKMAARLVLATVVPTWITLMGEKGAAGRLLPGATEELLSQTDASARSYLKARAEVASSAGIPAEIVVGRGNPARMIARMARGKSADLIVLGTHGRAGTRAFWAGSTAYRIIESTRAPILLVPAREDRR